MPKEKTSRTSHRYSPIPTSPLSRSTPRSTPIPTSSTAVPSGSVAILSGLSKKVIDDDDYDLSNAAALLPVKLDYTHKAYLNDFIPEFKSHVAKRGKRKLNATTWNHGFVVNKFIPHFFHGLNLTNEDVRWLIDNLGDKIYNFFGNHNKRDSRAKAPKVLVRTKAYGLDTYRKSCPEEHDAALQAILVEEAPELVGQKLSLSQLRSYSSRVFKALPLDQQTRWKDAAKDELSVERATATLTDPISRDRYVNSLVSTLQSLMAEAAQKANVRLSIQLLTEPSEGHFRLRSLVSPNLSDLAKSDSLATFLQSLKSHVEESVAGSKVEGGAPLTDIIIDWDNGGGPLLPDFLGLPLWRLRKLLRDFIKYKWAQAGGVGKVPWEEIGRAPHEWIEPQRLPPDATWMDPGSMRGGNTFSWLDGIRMGQSGETDDDCIFQFKQVIAGPNPIDASSSQETSRRLVNRDGREVYMLEFHDTITKCHAVGGVDGMNYSQSAMAYTLFRRTGKMRLDQTDPSSTASAAPTPPAEWMGLPFGAEVLRSAIYGAEKDNILSLTPALPQEHRERVENLVQLTNTHESHLPASNEIGHWGAPVPPPKVLPSTPPTSPVRTFFNNFWAETYYKAPTSIEETIFHIETWLESQIKSGALIHGPSGTLLGGETSVVWLVRLLILVFFNFSAVKYNIQFPHPIPTNCDMSRLPLNEWPRLLGQMDSLAQRLRDSISILQRTSEARALGLPSTHNDNDVDTELHELIASTMENHSTSMKRRRHRKDKKGKGKQREDEGWEDQSLDSDESSSSDEESNFEDKDKSGEQADSSSEEGGDKEKDGEEEESGNGDATGQSNMLDHDPTGECDFTPSTSTSIAASSTQVKARELTLNKGPSQYLFIDIKILSPDLNTDTQPKPTRSTPRRLAAAWRPRSHAFGSFQTIDRQDPPPPQSVVHALGLLDAAEQTWATAFRDLELLCDLHDKPLDIAAHIAKAKESAAPVFTKYLLHRRAGWERAESLSQSFFEINARVLSCFRDAFSLYSYLNHWLDALKQQENRSGNYSEADRVQIRIEKSSVLLVEARWTYLDAVAFEELATEYLNKYQGNWLRGELPDDLLGLYRLVKSQLDWADAFSKLQLEQVEKRKVLWDNLMLSIPLPRKYLSSGMRFAVGNPTSSQEPSRLRAALVKAAQDLWAKPHSRVQHSTIDEDTNMEDVSSSDPVTQQILVKSPTWNAQPATPAAPVASPLDSALPIVEPTSSGIKTAAPVVEPTSSIAEPVPSVAKPASSVVNPTPTILEPASSVAEPALSVVEPIPIAVEPTPTILEPAPTVVQPVILAVEPTLPVITSDTPIAPTPPTPPITAAPVVQPSASPVASSSAVKPTPQAPTSRKSSARLSNAAEASGTARRTSTRLTATPDTNAQLPQVKTWAVTTRASEAAQVAAKEAAAGKRKSKGRR
ncbi:hypothetical protein FRC12_001014 [Ceratobasidium sp. 428]|nr:hypothetical protein FRC12_001014 [Ceratobasidium sp. 428]